MAGCSRIWVRMGKRLAVLIVYVWEQVGIPKVHEKYYKQRYAQQSFHFFSALYLMPAANISNNMIPATIITGADDMAPPVPYEWSPER